MNPLFARAVNDTPSPITDPIYKHFCCTIIGYSFKIAQWKINVFNNVIVLIALASIIYLLVRLGSSQSRVLPVYKYFLIFAAVSFFFVVLSALVGDAAPGDLTGYRILQFFKSTVNGSQWFIQLSLVFFMFHNSTGRVAVRFSCILSGVLSVTFIFSVWFAFVFGNRKNTVWIGMLVVQWILVAIFVSISLLFLKREYAPRPAALWWTVFQALIHSCFGIAAAIYVHNSFNPWGHCVEALANLSYYLLYAIFLRMVIYKDSQYWRQKASLLNANEVLEETDPSRKLALMVQAGVRLIKMEDLDVKELIGVGNFGTVHRAIYQGTDVALKQLRTDRRKTSEQLLEALMHECGLFHVLRHPNLTMFIGICTSPTAPGVITEYLPKGSLWDLIDLNRNYYITSPLPEFYPKQPMTQLTIKRDQIVHSQLTWQRRIRILIDITKGMQYLHSCSTPILHRDLKSQNVLIDEFWNAKLCDFGLSRVLKLNSPMSSVGTPQWMAPEVINDEPYAEAADVFSFGVLLWELITLCPPWPHCSQNNVIIRVGKHDERLPLSPNCPQALESIVDQCFAQTTERPTFAELITKFQALYESNEYVNYQFCYPPPQITVAPKTLSQARASLPLPQNPNKGISDLFDEFIELETPPRSIN